MKAILKNRDKYFDIKLAKGIFLNSENSVKRDGERGISSATFGSVWFILPKGKALFKTYDDMFFSNIRKNRIINELVCNQLCKQINIPCPEILPAHLNSYTGLASYNVLKEDEQIVDGIQLARLAKVNKFNNVFDDYVSILNRLSRIGYKIDKTKTITDLYKMCIFDLLTLQTDRHEENVMFIYNEKTKEIKFAPLMDNEFAFMAKKLTSFMYSQNPYLEDHIERLYVFARKEFLVKKQKEDTASVERIVSRFVDLAVANSDCKLALKQIFCKLNIKEAIKNVKNMGYEISKEYCEFMESIVNYIKKEFADGYREKVNEKVLTTNNEECFER